MSEPDVLIRVEDLFFSYDGSRWVLRDVNLEIRRGEIIAIMGENGAGKTTLIKHFNGLLKPSRGRVVVLGMDTRNVSVARLSRHVGMVFQNPDHQIFSETVEREVEFALRNMNFGEDYIRKRVEWALKLMRLHKYRDRSPYALSVGERKRLAIASVLSYDPQILILDEPTAGQDFIQKEKISELINLMKYMGKTTIIVTHDVEFVLNRVERVILLSQGRVLADGDKRSILTNSGLLRRARLLPPQIPEIAEKLRERGLIGDRNCLYSEELAEAIASGWVS